MENILSASSRFKPYETIYFETPIVGVNGAKLISYTWAYEWTEDFDNVKGENVSKRVSDWTQAEQSADTGRGIVHQFTVELPSGETKTVSSESVLVLLGYTEREQLASFPSLVNALKTLAKQRMQLSIMEAKQKEYDEAFEKVSRMVRPSIVEKEYKKGEHGGVTVYSMGESTVWQNDKSVYNEKTGKSIYVKHDGIEDERKEALVDSWIRNELIKLGVSKQYGIYDLKNRIARQERKVEQLTGSGIKSNFANGGELKTIQYGDYVIFNKDSEETYENGVPRYKSGDGGHIKNIKEKDGQTFYSVQKGLTVITDIPASNVDLYKKDIREKVEEILTEKQEKKGFKDIGKRVSGSQKEKVALNKIINLSDLSAIEEDEITAIKTVVKERVYPEVNIEEQKLLGVTSGAVFIKVETRKACATTPPNDKKKRASYVKFINKFSQDTANAKTVQEIKDIFDSYEKWTGTEIIGYFLDPSFLDSSPEVQEKIQKFFNEKFRFSSFIVRKLVTEIFGKRFSNFIFRSSDTARHTWHEALSYEPISKEKSDELKEKSKERILKFISANTEKVEMFKSADSEKLKSEMYNFNFNDLLKKEFKKDIETFRAWGVQYYSKRVEDGVKSLDTPIPSNEQRENDWSWYEKDPQKRVIEKSKEIQINSGKPLSFIKRVGGIKITEQYVDLTKNTDLEKNPITSDFGFKTVQFGQSLQDKSAREHIRHFLGAMSDMSEMLGIDIKSLNKIGGLSIAFAARGKGKALATYEAGRNIINITNKRGDGTINHEYFHYIDNAITSYGKEGISLVFGSGSNESITNVKVAEKMKAIMDFIYMGKENITLPVKVLFKKSSRSYSSAPAFYSTFLKQNRQVTIFDTIDKTLDNLRSEYPSLFFVNYKYFDLRDRIFGYILNHFGLNEYEVPLRPSSSNFYYGSEQMQSPYWIKPHELFARASETYMTDKLIKSQRFNNYLVNDDMFDEVMLNNGRFTNVYPFGAEREYLYGLYNDFIDTIKSEYNLSGVSPISNDREDEYLVLEPNESKEENVDAGVVVDSKTDVVEEIIHDNKNIIPEQKELTKKDYEDAIESSQAMLEFSEGEQKQEILDYIESLKVMLDTF